MHIVVNDSHLIDDNGTKRLPVLDKKITSLSFECPALESLPELPDGIERLDIRACTNLILTKELTERLQELKKCNIEIVYPDAVAQYNLGAHHEHGIVVEQNYERAFELFTSAANQGFAIAQFRVGLYYGRGIEVAKNEEAAVRFYKLAADQGHTQSQHNLAVCFGNGIGVAKDEKEAVRFYKLAADQGHTQSQHNLAVCFGKGIGVAKDEKEAVRLHELAAGKGFAESQYSLGLFYKNGIGVEQNQERAFEFFTSAANQGFAIAQFRVGFYYQDGIVVAKNEKAAVRFYKLAADQGFAKAQHNLAFCFGKGIGVAKNEEEAVRFYKLAADQGFAESQYSLGFCYENGIGVAKDHSSALKFYVKSAKQGEKSSLKKLSKEFKPENLSILKTLTKDEINEVIKIAEPEANLDYKERLQNPSSHFIGKFVEKSQETLSLKDLLEIRESLQNAIGTPKPSFFESVWSQSNSTTMIENCIFNKVKKYLKEKGVCETTDKMQFTFQDHGIECKIDKKGKSFTTSKISKSSYSSSDLTEALNPMHESEDYSAIFKSSGRYNFSFAKLENISNELERTAATYNSPILSGALSATQLKEVGKSHGRL